MKKTIITSVILIFIFSLLTGSAMSGGFAELTAFAEESGSCGDNLIWALSDSGTLTISGSGEMEDFGFLDNIPWNTAKTEIKSIVIGTGVTSISDEAFSGCSAAADVTVPSSVTVIGSRAFGGCKNLESIVLPANLTSIGSKAFADCTALKSVNIPAGVGFIGSGAFYCCTGLTSVTVDPGNTKYDSRNGCCALIETQSAKLLAGCRNTVIPEGIKIIGEAAFCNCDALTLSEIPSGVVSVEKNAFCNCTGILSLTVPDSVTAIGDFAFQNVNNIIYSPNMTASGSPWDAKCINGFVEGDIVYTDPSKSVLAGCTSAASGAAAIPDTVKHIARFAFLNCAGLTSISIPSGVETIGFEAFSGCSGITDISIPASITKIGESAFFGCSSVESIAVDPANTVYDSRNDCSAIIETASDTLIFGCNNTVIPDSVTSIGSGAFSGCNLSGISIPDSITDISESAFDGCSGDFTISCNCGSAVEGYAKEHSIKLNLTHSFTNYVYNNDATTEKDGTKTAKCDRCDETDTVTAPGTRLPGDDNPTKNAAIKTASAVKLNYRTVVTVKATASGVPEGYYLSLYINGDEAARGSSTEVSYLYGELKNDIDYSVRIIDKDGNIQKDGSGNDLIKSGGKITCSKNFFKRVIAFFRALFNKLPKETVSP